MSKRKKNREDLLTLNHTGAPVLLIGMISRAAG